MSQLAMVDATATREAERLAALEKAEAERRISADTRPTRRPLRPRSAAGPAAS